MRLPYLIVTVIRWLRLRRLSSLSKGLTCVSHWLRSFFRLTFFYILQSSSYSWSYSISNIFLIDVIEQEHARSIVSSIFWLRLFCWELCARSIMLKVRIKERENIFLLENCRFQILRAVLSSHLCWLRNFLRCYLTGSIIQHLHFIYFFKLFFYFISNLNW